MDSLKLLDELVLNESDSIHREQIRLDLERLLDDKAKAMETLIEARQTILKLRADYWTLMSQLTQVQLELISVNMNSQKERT